MLDISIEVIRTLIGVSSGVLALAFAFITIRTLVWGRDAYEANRRITPTDIWSVWSGRLRSDVEDIDGRASHGVAINLKTGKLEEQRRLSTEAIDDVIGRRAI
ncbi:hypothetical protein [Roseivivax jejudonensis]|uniref:hypothetical protein n=1 Tax=Roseivivax jejudonensis TaxID=1529041 RepID=UPI00117B0A9A|nr:hypothetical protein [Roseivivax jejudonensis]